MSRILAWYLWWPGHQHGRYGGQDTDMAFMVDRTPTWQVWWLEYQHGRHGDQVTNMAGMMVRIPICRYCG
jgi:hypothetical protein